MLTWNGKARRFVESTGALFDCPVGDIPILNRDCLERVGWRYGEPSLRKLIRHKVPPIGFKIYFELPHFLRGVTPPLTGPSGDRSEAH
jgi:hypothetical protein